MRVDEIDVTEYRQTEHGADPWFLSRWSPRAMSGEEIGERELMTLLDAARWAPSSYNNQPWRFVYARRGTEHWDRIFDLMGEFNQSWTKNAAVLMVVVSRDTFEHNDKPARTHSYDTGAAWMSLALQGTKMGLVVHGMQGFDYEKARTELGVPDGYSVEAMCAVGRPGNVEDLDEKTREREKPSPRKEIGEIAMEGVFRR